MFYKFYLCRVFYIFILINFILACRLLSFCFFDIFLFNFLYFAHYFQIESCVKIDKEIRSMEETVELNPSYIKKVNIAPDEDLGNQKLSANFAV